MRPVMKRRHDAEIPAPATQPPKEIRIDLVIGRYNLAICGDDFAGKEIITGQSVLAHEPTDAASEREARYAGPGNDTEGNR